MAANNWLLIATPAIETVSIAMGPDAKVPVVESPYRIVTFAPMVWRDAAGTRVTPLAALAQASATQLDEITQRSDEPVSVNT